MASTNRPMYTIPIAERPSHGPWFSKIFFPILFNCGMIGIATTQILMIPLLLIPFGIGKSLFTSGIEWTKDGYGRLLILITVLFGPTSLVLTTDSPPPLEGLVERDSKTGRMTKINLPDRLVIMANHQAYTDWMYLWILACYAGHARGIIILLKKSLRSIPLIGWGMRFFKFIFLSRSWAADRENLTLSITALARDAQSGEEIKVATANSKNDSSESEPLTGKPKQKGKKRSPLWLLIFPEGTITSDEERAKSVKYAEKQGVDDFVTLLHPRSTGLLFCLRTLVPQIPDLQLLDVTIGYPGVPYGKYPQEWYGLLSIFLRSVPPPTVHIHLHLYSDLSSPKCQIPSLTSSESLFNSNPTNSSPSDPTTTLKPITPNPDTGVASPEEAREFELWLRGVWTEKEKRMKGFFENGQFQGLGGEDAKEVIPIRQLKWYHWIGAFGGGGIGTFGILGTAIWRGITRTK